MFVTSKTFEEASDCRRPGADSVRRLAPFADCNDVRIAQVCAASRLEHLPRGPLPPGDADDERVFLHRGKLTIESTNGLRQPLSHDQAGSVFPLPHAHVRQISALTPCQLIRVPSRFLLPVSGGDVDMSGGYGIDCREGEIEDQLFLDFYQQLKAGKCELPSMPDLARRIGEVIDDPATASEHIARVIQSDPALAARVMSVVNSAAYGAGQSIASLPQAVSRLGREQIRNLVFSFIVRDIFQTDAVVLKQRMQALWSHSCHVAAIAAILARHTRGMDPERALLAGLIHDIGVVPVLDQARHHPQLLDNPQQLDRVIAELRGEIGALTMRQWGFGQDMVDIVAHAEDWQRMGSAIPDDLDVVLLAQLHAYIGTPRMTKLPHIDQIPAFRKLVGGELTPRGSLRVIEAASREIAELRQLLEAP